MWWMSFGCFTSVWIHRDTFLTDTDFGFIVGVPDHGWCTRIPRPFAGHKGGPYQDRSMSTRIPYDLVRRRWRWR